MKEFSKDIFSPEYYDGLAKDVEKKMLSERLEKVNKLREKGKESMKIIQLMSFVEELMEACGGEKKANFLEVSRDMLRIGTRVPMKVNIFPFLRDNENNPRFHKVVTEVLMEMDVIERVQWIPQSNGAILLVECKRNT